MRLLVGIGLVLGSVVIGAVVVSRADSTRPMLAVSHDLAAGTVLAAADVHPTKVRLASAQSTYVAGDVVVAGRMLSRPLLAGELVPKSALVAAPADETTLTIPVRPENSPEIARGQRVAVWVSTRYCQAALVVGDVTVQNVRGAGSGALSAASQESLVVRTPKPLALRVITALGLDGATIRIGVLTGAVDPTANDSLPTLNACLDPARSS